MPDPVPSTPIHIVHDMLSRLDAIDDRVLPMLQRLVESSLPLPFGLEKFRAEVAIGLKVFTVIATAIDALEKMTA